MKRCLLLLFIPLLLVFDFTAAAQKPPNETVYIIPIKGTIDLGLAEFIDRSLSEARSNHAETVIFDVDTLGGRVDAALKIRDAIIRSGLNTVSFVDKRAISAGALICLATKTIIMAPGGTIGAAKPVQSGFGRQAAPVDEKIVSFLRKEFKSTAELNKHPAKIAEAFVDQDVKIEGISDKGKLLTITTEEALRWKLASFKASSINDAIEKLGLENCERTDLNPNWAEKIVRMLTHPIVSSILLTIGIMGIIVELKTPGIGLPGLLGVMCILAFFFAQYLVGLANWLDLIVFSAGIVLLLLEIFVIPGFGAAGVSGLILIIAGIFMALVKRPVPSLPIPSHDIWQAVIIIGSSLSLSILMSIIIFRYILPKTSLAGGIILKSEERSESGFVSSGSETSLAIGDTGLTSTTLRPSGKCAFNDTLIEVLTQGEMIERNTKVRIIEITGNKIIVKSI
ncbi:nodulation protein NfeD [Candidatus Auribacterota bacterium]